MPINGKIEVDKPWGKFEQFVLNQQCTVKILTVLPDARLSYQSHGRRAEFWRCISGKVLAVVDGETHFMIAGSEIWIPCGAKHRLIGGSEGGQVLEISFGQFDEEDIVRYEDDYGRQSK